MLHKHLFLLFFFFSFFLFWLIIFAIMKIGAVTANWCACIHICSILDVMEITIFE